MKMPVTNLVADGEALPNGQTTTVDRYDRSLLQSYNRCFATVERPISDGSAEMPGDRFKVDFVWRRDAEGNQKSLSRRD